MENFVECSNVNVKKGKYGYGVYAAVDIKKGELIEKGIMMIMNNTDGNENPHLFTWSDDKTVWASGSGCLPFYNHSNEPNIKKIGDLKKNLLNVIALKDIKKGDELLGTYYSRKWRKCFKDLID
tara:strand:- start:1341 stop:1712 length:372 start_codon:yes stop_codon:yes gene_type:complete